MFPSCFYQNQPQVGDGWSKSKLLHPKHPPRTKTPPKKGKQTNGNMRQKLTRHVVNVAHTAGDATTPIQRTSNRSRQGVPFLSEDSHGIFIDMLWWARSHQHVSEKCETLLNIVKHPPNRKISTETPDVDTELCRGVVVTATLAIFEILNCNGILNA